MGDGLCCGLNVGPPPHSCVAILMHSVIVLEGRAFGRSLSYEGGALRNVISTR